MMAIVVMMEAMVLLMMALTLVMAMVGDIQIGTCLSDHAGLNAHLFWGFFSLLEIFHHCVALHFGYRVISALLLVVVPFA